MVAYSCTLILSRMNYRLCSIDIIKMFSEHLTSMNRPECKCTSSNVKRLYKAKVACESSLYDDHIKLTFTNSKDTPFTQLLQTRVCFTNAGMNTYGAEIHKVRKYAIHAFPSFLFLILLFRLYVQEPFSEIMERQNNRLV